MGFAGKRTSLLNAFWLLTATLASAAKINVTAVTASNGKSTLECWQIDAPFVVSTTAGISGTAIAQLGDVTNVDFSVVPPNFDGGLHNAPRNQWVMVTSGLAHITVPGDDSDGVYIQRGESGLIFAADTPGLSEGHYISYPGIMETTALLFPTKDRAVPARRVVRPGPCLVSETAGFRALAGMN
ncbi:ATP release protein [Apiospora arundinis]